MVTKDVKHRLRWVFGFLLLTALVYLIYWPGLNAPFYFDDAQNIVSNPKIQVDALGWNNLREAALESPLSTRPVANISFALNYYFHAYETIGYRIVNISIHLVNGVLLFYFIRFTLKLSVIRRVDNNWVIFCCVLLWLVHPLHIQSVTYIVQRMNSLAVLFYMLALILYVQGKLIQKSYKVWLFFSGSTVCWLFAMGTKEIAATLPFFILLYEWYFFRNLSKAWLGRALLGLGIAGTLVLIFTIFYLDGNFIANLVAAYQSRDFTLTERLLTQPRVVFYYLGLLLYPHPSLLTIDHEFLLSASFWEPISTVFSAGLLFFLLILSICIARKHRLISFCMLWFLGQLAIESSILPLEILFEHRTYLPSMGLCLLMIIAINASNQRSWKLYFIPVVLGATAVVWSYWTYERNMVWSDPVLFWQDAVEKAPNKLRPRFRLGMVLVQSERKEEALLQYSEAIQIGLERFKNEGTGHVFTDKNIALSDILFNRGVLYQQKGDLPTALADFEHAILVYPKAFLAILNRGAIRQTLGDLEGAMRDFNRVIQIQPQMAAAYLNRGVIYQRLGRLEDAIADYSKAIDLDSDNAIAYSNRGYARMQQDRYKEALTDLDAAVRANSDYARAYGFRGNLRLANGDFKGALADYQKVIDLNPDDPIAHSNLGLLRKRLGDLTGAAQAFSKAIEVAPAGWSQRRIVQKMLDNLNIQKNESFSTKQ